MNTIDTALFSGAAPCNPIPFANGLAALVREKGTDAIRSDEGKRILYVLIAQAYGQGVTLDPFAEFERLRKAYEAETGLDAWTGESLAGTRRALSSQDAARV